jgi:hypothetical protein
MLHGPKPPKPGPILVVRAHQPNLASRADRWDRSVCLRSLLTVSNAWVRGRAHGLASGRALGGPTCQRSLLPGCLPARCGGTVRIITT